MKAPRGTLGTYRAGTVAERGDRWDRLLQGLDRTQKPTRRDGTSQSQASGLEMEQAPSLADLLLLRGPAGRAAVRAAAGAPVAAETVCAGEALEWGWPAGCPGGCCPEEPRGPTLPGILETGPRCAVAWLSAGSTSHGGRAARGRPSPAPLELACPAHCHSS